MNSAIGYYFYKQADGIILNDHHDLHILKDLGYITDDPQRGVLK